MSTNLLAYEIQDLIRNKLLTGSSSSADLECLVPECDIQRYRCAINAMLKSKEVEYFTIPTGSIETKTNCVPKQNIQIRLRKNQES